jgi:hypothetical protein
MVPCCQVVISDFLGGWLEASDSREMAAVTLKPGAFLVQGVTTFPTVRALHRLGALPTFAKVFDGLWRWLGKPQEPSRHCSAGS